jgi:penicillin amidase
LGEYEWSGYLNSADHPMQFNPPRHEIITANNNILPQGYSHQLAYYWASPERYERISQLLSQKPKFDVPDFEKFQNDTVSLIAQQFVKLLETWTPETVEETALKEEFLHWDADLRTDSELACIFEVWSGRLSSKLTAKILPVPRINPRAVLASLKTAPEASALLSQSLREATSELERRLGPDRSRWKWGNLHHAYFRHPLDLALQPDINVAPATFGLDSAAAHREHTPDIFDIPSVARPGDAATVNATGGGPNYSEAYGASYRQILDLNDWDRSVMTNVPGESGVPGSQHYADLVLPWSKGEYHAMPFSRPAVEAATEEKITLVPAK